MQKPYIVFTGTASVGKTTLLKPLVPMLEKVYGESVVHIAEVARSLERRGFKINKDATASTQRLIEDEYLRLEAENFDKIKIADRSIIDRFSYSLLNTGDLSPEEKTNKLTLLKWYNDNVAEHCKKYTHIFHIPLTGDVKLELDGVRSADEHYRKQIADIQTRIISLYNIKVYQVEGSVEDRLDIIKKVLEKTSGISV